MEFLDAYAESQGIPSRSAVLLKPVRLLRSTGLGAAYEDAWKEWATGDDSDLWDVAVDDGIS